MSIVASAFLVVAEKFLHVGEWEILDGQVRVPSSEPRRNAFDELHNNLRNEEDIVPERNRMSSPQYLDSLHDLLGGAARFCVQMVGKLASAAQYARLSLE